MAVVWATALALSTILPFKWRILTFKGWNEKYHFIIVIKTNLSGFVVTMHSGLCEQHVQSTGLMALALELTFTCALLHCDNKPLQNRSQSLNYSRSYHHLRIYRSPCVNTREMLDIYFCTSKIVRTFCVRVRKYKCSECPIGNQQPSIGLSV